jgi:SAM-dependent methyltransferase
MPSILQRYLNYIYQDMVNKRLSGQIAHVQARPNAIYLDLGCHVGYNTDRVRQVVMPRQTIGLEFDPVSAAAARARDIEAVCHDLNQPIPLAAGSIDIVTVYDVIEHLVETWQFITEVYRVLRPGGRVVIDSPNLAAWHNVFSLVLGYQPTSGPHLVSIADSDFKVVASMHRRDHNLDEQANLRTTNVSKMHRHIVVPAYRSLRRVLQQAGFEIENSWGYGYYPFPPLLSTWLCKLDIGHAHHYLIKARKPVTAPG